MGDETVTKLLFSARGRSNRGQFWTVVFIIWITLAISGFIVSLVGESTPGIFVALIVAPFILAAIYAGWVNAIRRLHDMGRSGWWMLLPVLITIPLGIVRIIIQDSDVGIFSDLLQFALNLGFVAVIGAPPGQKGANRFGDPPGAAAQPEPA